MNISRGEIMIMDGKYVVINIYDYFSNVIGSF